jgi:hypothetical protein
MSHISVGKINPEPEYDLIHFENMNIPPWAFDVTLVCVFIYFIVKLVIKS